MCKPKVAIYMSCYNHEKFVREAMDSIINQTYQNWELYVVNDASTDKTGEILATYKDQRVHYFDFKINTRFIGAANFLQKILRVAEVDYIATMSSDDKWELDKLEKQMDVLMKHPEYKACFTWDKVIFDTEGGVYRGRENYSHKKNKSRYDWMYHFFYYGNCLNACSMLMDKKVFYELGKMNENFIQLGDYRLWFKLVCRYPFYLLEEELTYYRRHDTNLSEPTIEVLIRDANEGYRITCEIMDSMTASDFHRAFYKELPYIGCNSKEEILAEQFIILIEARTVKAEQAAIDLYFRHCNEEKFVEILEKKYNFTAKDFLDLSGNGGLQYNIASIFKHPLLERKERKICSPASILLNILDEGKIDEEILVKLRYSTLCDLYDLTEQYVEGKEQFLQIRGVIDALRKRRQERKVEKKVLILIAENSDWDILEGLEQIMEKGEAEYYFAYIPPRWKYFLEEEASNRKGIMPVGIEQVDIYDKKEHCLRFGDEFSKRVDVIWYIDCLNHEYECGDMIAGYALEVEHRCIISETIYADMQNNAMRNLQMMSEIRLYK